MENLRWKLAGVVCVHCSLSVASATAGDVCNAALRPTEEATNTNYSSMQTYMSLNAEYEYDKFKKNEGGYRSASASYKFFSADFEESNNREEFGERIRNKLSQSASTMNEAQASSVYRSYLTEAQLNAWSECQRIQGRKQGMLLLAVNRPKQASFPLELRFSPPSGVIKEYTVQIKLDGGVFQDTQTATRNEPVTGVFGDAWSRRFIVVPKQTGNRVLAIANTLGDGYSDTLEVDFNRPIVSPPAKKAIVVRASSLIDAVNVCAGGWDGSYPDDVVLNCYPNYQDAENKAAWEFDSALAGKYRLRVDYATLESRSVRIVINGQQTPPLHGDQSLYNALPSTGGGYHVFKTVSHGNVTLKSGRNRMEIERNHVFPHFRAFIFEPQ